MVGRKKNHRKPSSLRFINLAISIRWVALKSYVKGSPASISPQAIWEKSWQILWDPRWIWNDVIYILDIWLNSGPRWISRNLFDILRFSDPLTYFHLIPLFLVTENRPVQNSGKDFGLRRCIGVLAKWVGATFGGFWVNFLGDTCWGSESVGGESWIFLVTRFHHVFL